MCTQSSTQLALYKKHEGFEGLLCCFITLRWHDTKCETWPPVHQVIFSLSNNGFALCTQGMFDWVDILESKLDSMSPVGTDLETVKQQIVELKVWSGTCVKNVCVNSRMCLHAETNMIHVYTGSLNWVYSITAVFSATEALSCYTSCAFVINCPGRPVLCRYKSSERSHIVCDVQCDTSCAEKPTRVRLYRP